jgi:signal transduction histidine kinase
VQVLRGQFSPGTFKGKLVLVGATASGMADSLPTPVSGFKQPMPGVEFLANTLISMRSHTLIQRAPLWLSTALACVLALLPMAWLPYVRTRTGLGINLVYGVLVLCAAMALPLYFHVWVPLSAGLLGLLSAYPLWAWRKLESASQFLDAELQRLQLQLGEQHSLHHPATAQARQGWVDPFQRRIEQVRSATTQLQHLDETQRETLAFVSHDIRVPLASAAIQIRQELGEHHPAHLQLERALRWTEDFLQTARAQMLSRENFAELEITALLHEAVDEIYPLAQKQQLLLEISLPEDPQWVQGNAETLLRAVTNLLGNALKFSPSGGRIGLQARIESKQIFIDVTDQGPGIAPEAKASLFKRFSRPQGDGVHTGAGLGLYFVHTVAHHHGGTVKYSRLPSRTCFCISLPLSQQETKNLNISQFKYY